MNRLIVHIPLLESLPGGSAALPPLLGNLLARARRVEGDTDVALASLFGSAPLPAPAVLSALSGPGIAEEDAGRHWLRFDPVRLVPDLTAVWMDRPLPLDFGAKELAPVVDELRIMFEHERLDWRPQAGGFGLLCLKDTPDCVFLPPDAVHGRRLDDVLPTGSDASRWRRLINESQMVFHQFRPLSRADQQGVGLWFWGAGAPAMPAGMTTSVCLADRSGSALVRGLANWLEADMLEPAAEFGDASAACRYVHWPLQATDIELTLAHLTDAWLKPALRELRRGQLAEIDIVGSSGYWRLGRLGGFAVWRRAVEGFETAEEAD